MTGHESITSAALGAGIVEVVMAHPPVNALPVAGWFALAEAVTAAGADPDDQGRCAARRGQALQRRGGHQGDAAHRWVRRAARGEPRLLRGFKAVYECAVPVISAVHGACVGGGIGLVGNADVIVAAQDAVFGLPEVDRGALGAATHLARLVPQHRMRAMVYTAANATAAELHGYGSVHAVVPRESLRDSALELARSIAGKDPVVIRAAKQSLNGIDRGRRQPQLPLRAGLHLRAQPDRGVRPDPRRVRGRGCHVQVGTVTSWI